MCEQVAWAHSEHGSVVACGSEDGLVTIWQQAQITRGQAEQWLRRATLTDSHKPITCLTFAPVQLGLQLAVASGDGYVRFYEASASLNADSWRLCNDLHVGLKVPAAQNTSTPLVVRFCITTCMHYLSILFWHS